MTRILINHLSPPNCQKKKRSYLSLIVLNKLVSMAQIPIEIDPETEKGEKLKKYLTCIYVSKNSTPSFVTVTELNYR